MILLLDHQKVNSSLALHHNVKVTYLSSSHRVGAVSSHVIMRGRATTVEGLRDHTHITFTTVLCYHPSILSLVIMILVNLVLCLVYKLNFTMGMYVWGEKPSIYRFQSSVWFPASPGDLGMCLPWRRDTTVIQPNPFMLPVRKQRPER